MTLRSYGVATTQGTGQLATFGVAAQTATIDSLVTQLFGGAPDENVAAAARDAARAAIDAVAPSLPAARLQRAEAYSNSGLAAMSALDFKTAVKNFTAAFRVAQRG